MSETQQTFLFTPRFEDRTRLHLQLSADDYRKVKRGGDWEATVTDQTTGKQYTVIGAECSQPNCYCDALIVREL